MLNKLNKRKEGFTIVEVLIVLAIAGVIMLVIFLAVPALQRNARNNQRRSDASHLAGLINEYAANHAGSLPTCVGAGVGCVDLTNEHWAIMTAPANANLVATNTFGTQTTMNVNRGFTCDTTTNALTAGSARSFAISYQVETGGAATNSCIGG